MGIFIILGAAFALTYLFIAVVLGAAAKRPGESTSQVWRRWARSLFWLPILTWTLLTEQSS
jgi:hypothetical protein